MTTRRRKKHRPEEIVAKLRDAEAMLNAGKDLAVVLQALEVSESTYDRWRAQYGGMKCEEAKRLKQLEDENKRLKTLVAEFLPEALQPRVAALLADPRAEATATAWRMFLKSPVLGTGLGT